MPNAHKKIDQNAKVLGQYFFGKSKQSLLKIIANPHLEVKSPLVIFTPNPEHLMITREKPGFEAVLAAADVRVPDGIWIVIASRLLQWVGKSQPIAERIPGVELTVDLLQLAVQKKWKVLIIGGRGYHQRTVVIDETIKHERGLFFSPWNKKWTIVAVGEAAQSSQWQPNDTPLLHWLNGYEDAGNPTVKEEIEVKKCIETLKPDVVLVALGAPLQEEWILNHYEILSNSKVKIAMVVGGAFDMLTGKTKRAPLLYRKLGFEWVYRLWLEPWRWKRQLRLIRFLLVLFKELVVP